MREILRFEHVSYGYDVGSTEKPALRDCSVSVGEGERIAVLGNNGAGKSTFFLLANGVLQPREGTVFYQGKPVGKSSRDRNLLRRGVGLVFQDPEVQILGGTVEEEISFGPMNLGLPEAEVRRRVEAEIRHFSLEALRKRAPQYLSGGEKKRVSIADVMAMEPRVLLLDEPAASLDPANCRLLEENLERMEARGLSFLIATHDVEFAWRWARRLLIFCDGELVADGAPESVFADQALLDTCHLEQPLLFRVARALKIAPAPKTIEALEHEMICGKRPLERRT